MTMFAGFNAKVILTDSLGVSNSYAVASWVVDANAPELPCDNTEGLAGHAAATSAEGYAASLTGLKFAHIKLVSATYDDSNNVLGTPFNIREGTFFSMDLYPAGFLGARWAFSGVVCTKVMIEGSAPGLQPITIEGRSDGQYEFNE